VQNGVGNEEAIAPHVPRVIRGTTFPAGRLVEPGVVHQDTGGDTTLGPFEPKPARMDEVETLAELMDQSGMSTKALPDARGAQWRKVHLQRGDEPARSAHGLTHGQACDVPALTGAHALAGRRGACGL
jgi:2-dehydropantoate 2-reductase